jgi:DNA polymerase-3 subunit epsilon
VLPDPPYLAALVAELDHAGLEMNVLAYLELVERAVADLHLDADERRQLNEFAVDLGLSEAQRAQAHRRFVNGLIDAAIADHVVTDEELDLLLRVTSALEVDAKTVEMRTRAARGATVRVTLEPGITVVFTGDDPDYERSELTGIAEAMGLIVGKGVTKKTDLLVAVEPDSNSGKAAKARSYDIPIISNAQFHAASVGDTIEGHGSTVAAKKVITCPDCHATWTVAAASGAKSSQRCVDCVGAAMRAPDHSTAEEELICGACGRTWTRPRTRGRKPTNCPDCS